MQFEKEMVDSIGLTKFEETTIDVATSSGADAATGDTATAVAVAGGDGDVKKRRSSAKLDTAVLLQEVGAEDTGGGGKKKKGKGKKGKKGKNAGAEGDVAVAAGPTMVNVLV